MRPRKFHLIALAVLCLIGAIGPSPALGVIVGSTDFSAFSDPLSPYYGMTADYVYKYGAAAGDTTRNGTINAIGYFTLITARHYDPSVNDKFTIAGDQFQVTAVQYPPADAGQAYVPDIDILTVTNLTHPNRPLPGFYQIVQTQPYAYQPAVIVGAGHTGTIAGNIPTEDPSSPMIVRWGTNKYDITVPKELGLVAPPNPISSDTLCFRMKFNESGVTTDCTYGVGDSGGGVFFEDGTSHVWKLGGLNLYNGWNQYPYDTDAASLYTYRSWISSVLATQRLPGDADGDNDVDVGDYFALKENYGRTGMTWAQGDFNGDGVVDNADLAILEMNWGYKSPLYDPAKEGYTPTMAPGGLVPEPATLALLAAGAVGLLLRRSCRSGRR